ncbi:MAG: NAD-glutamate dehydrogenase [Betaproteobacteria bacterium]|nr:NAD-glutamate dehydrogenase [Betaproteobacteria bacterium]
MPSPSTDPKQSILEPVTRLAGQRLSGAQAKEAREFVSLYYGQVDAEDLEARAPEDLYGAAMTHLAFARQFASGTPKLRVYNPKAQEHGWASPHTVIEIVNDDMPFLVDSVTMELNRQGRTLHLLVHPLAQTVRDPERNLISLAPAGREGARESFIHVEVDRESDPARLKEIGEGLLAVLADVRCAVEDWRPMREAMQAIVGEFARPPREQDAADVEETRAFLSWALEENFTFIGFREYELAASGGEDQLRIVAGSGLGVLREPRLGGVSQSFRDLPAAIKALAREPRLLVLTKANSRATVHRPGYLDYVGVKKFDASGRVTGERRFVGLYTSAAYHADPGDIPLLRRKVARILERAGFPAASHGYKNLVSLLHAYPRDELFQVDEASLLEIALAVLRLGDRRRTRLFLRRDLYGRFFSCLIYVPRENFNTDVRRKIEEILRRRLAGTSAEYTVQLTDAVLARIHMLVRTRPLDEPRVDVHAIEAEIIQATRRWEDDLKLALTEAHGEERALLLYGGYSAAFPVAYRDTLSARTAVRDIAVIETLGPGNPFAVSLYRPVEADARTLRLRVYRVGEKLTLSASLPILENMGLEVLDEDGWEVQRKDAPAVFLHDFGLRSARDLENVEAIKAVTEEALLRVARGEIENDAFNRLTPTAALASDDVVVLRAYAKYLKQAGFTFSQAYIAQTLAAHPTIVAKLVALFHARFDPAAGADRDSRQQTLHDEVKTALNDVANLDEDRILRRCLYAIRATIRTNHWVRGGNGRRKPYLALKFESAKVPDLPEPRPLFEVFVYSPRFEAIHLRGGKVARGGLRWSDRPEDFRTEVLGLMKAQMVKNAVIVPVGSKGGFVLKAAPPASEREAYLKEGVACYQDFLRGLLDVTDNLKGGKVIPPKDVVRHDPDDPYLVVAADKGTAAFSDYANAVSAEYGHWLADAFASGGSAGYDHKKMGITAKGAWESVKRHFREMGLDTQSQDFTVAGVGDMSGDVFGNGMLLSRHIRLLAAFDHRHIFLDPDPDPAKSFAERERMFALPRSSWDDYDKALISKGGGIYPRAAKSIAVSPQVRKALGVAEESLTPAELMKAILKAPVDLLYNGGIGTYVKAGHQTHADVGDRANDAIRVNGAELRCKVVGEGGNLGFTQLGRVEFALSGGPEGKGGRICTDAIDNSGGVDCSDHEVNIKILLGLVTADGELTEKQRNKLLVEMTDEVGHLVLADNYFQTQSLSVAGVRGDKLLDAQASLIRALEKAGRLNRAVEFLPSDDEIAERRAQRVGLTTPERAVLLAYSKMVLYDDLVKGTLIDDDYVACALTDYFPAQIRSGYAAVLPRHPLKREIIATAVANSMINRTGSVFVQRMKEETGATPDEVTRAFILVRDVFGFEALWAAIDALDNRVTCAVQSEMLIEAGRLVLRATLWFLRRRREQLPIAQVLGVFQPGLAAFRAGLPAILSAVDRDSFEATAARLSGQGVPLELARSMAGLDALYSVLDTTEVARETERPLEAIAQLHFALAGDLELHWFAERITALPTDTPWQALARNALRDDLASQQRLLTTCVARLSPGSPDPAAMIAAWKDRYAQPIARLAAMRDELKRAGPLDLAVLSVLLRELRGLA